MLTKSIFGDLVVSGTFGLGQIVVLQTLELLELLFEVLDIAFRDRLAADIDALAQTHQREDGVGDFEARRTGEPGADD